MILREMIIMLHSDIIKMTLAQAIQWDSSNQNDN